MVISGNDFLKRERDSSQLPGGAAASQRKMGGVVISYSAVPAEEAADCNNSIYGNNLSNRETPNDEQPQPLG